MGTGIYPQFMHSFQANAPQMNGNDGSQGQILQVLDACLITGFNQQTAVSSAINGEYITITFGVTHGYERLQFIDVSGANDSNFNGRKRILSVTPTTITIAKEAVTAIDGTITTKISPLGWESIFGNSDSNQRAYRSKDLTSPRTVLYLDCTKKGTGYASSRPMQRARVRVCRDMTTLGQQIESYTDGKDSGVDGKFHWFQAKNSTFANSNTLNQNSNWTLIGDGKIFYFIVGYNNYASDWRQYLNAFYIFGDIPKLSPNDVYNCIFTCTEYDIQSNVAYTAYFSHWNTFTAQLNSASNGEGVGMYFIKTVEGASTLDYFKKIATISTGGYNSSGNTDNASINPLTLGYHYSDVVPIRVQGMIPTAPLPYLKAIANSLQGFYDLLHLKRSKDYLLCSSSATNGSSSSSSSTYSYMAYYAFNLMEERLADGG